MVTRMTVIVLASIVGAIGCGSSEPPSVDATDEADTAEFRVDPTAIRPFTIAVSDEVLTDLDARLARTRFPDQVGTNWGLRHRCGLPAGARYVLAGGI